MSSLTGYTTELLEVLLRLINHLVLYSSHFKFLFYSLH